MRDASTLVGRDWRISWKKVKDSEKIDWREVAGELWQVIIENDCSTKEFFDELVRNNTTIKPGSRRFLTKWGINDNSENKEKEK